MDFLALRADQIADFIYHWLRANWGAVSVLLTRFSFRVWDKTSLDKRLPRRADICSRVMPVPVHRYRLCGMALVSRPESKDRYRVQAYRRSRTTGSCRRPFGFHPFSISFRNSAIMARQIGFIHFDGLPLRRSP